MTNITKKMILTAGPSITQKEVGYVADAAMNGWNQHHSDYLVKFENAFADYVGASQAMATSSCTGAMHMALLGLGIGPGDEVIVPEITWIATAAAVVYTGATPVFCDVDIDSWTMLPESVEKLITPKTKALMPVHIYGHPCDMNPLWVLAKKHNLHIVEDAAQSIGAEYNGQKTGSLGTCAGFSFQGAKAMVTGEGGIFTTSDEVLLKRVRYIGDHGRDPSRTLYNTAIGYKYKMSNVQAALGLAQIQRVETLVDKKIQIFKWYEERLGDIEEIALNVQKSWAKNIYWMSSIVLGDAVESSRDEFMAGLKARHVDSRPIFYPISDFPMFDSANNPNAYKVGLRGINLPSGHERTEEEIDYICAHIRELLGKGMGLVQSTQPHGWLAVRDGALEALASAKKEKIAVPLSGEGFDDWQLTSVAADSVGNDVHIQAMMDWRAASQDAFPSQFKVTFDGTKNWTQKQLLDVDDRILFFIENKKTGELAGHVGLFRFNFVQQYCELDNIIRGTADAPAGIMTAACAALMGWTRETLGMQDIYLRVMSNNDRAIALYKRLGFAESIRVPLQKEEGPNSVHWKEIIADPYIKAERYFVTMLHAA